MRVCILVVQLYFVVFGLLAFLWPALPFEMVGIEPPNHLWLSQILGLVTLIFGIGLVFPLYSPLDHWPVLFIAFVAQISIPAFNSSLTARGVFPESTGGLLVLADLISAVPLAAVLIGVYLRFASDDVETNPELSDALSIRPMGSTESLLELSKRSPLLLVLLRHSGCTFCRSIAVELRDALPDLQKRGIRPVLVGMSHSTDMFRLAENYGLEEALIVSDPERFLYRALGVGRGRLWQLFGPRVLKRAFLDGLLFRHGIGPVDGDPFQLHGAFILKEGRISASFRSNSVADEMPVDELLESCPLP